jgi:hypothetical protein
MIKNDDPRSDPLWIVVGCVDNPAARQQLARTLQHNKPNEAPDVWWLDCGNHLEAGQVLLALPQKSDYASTYEANCVSALKVISKPAEKTHPFLITAHNPLCKTFQ